MSYYKEIKEVGIFFITGRPRSGTTLLRALFDAHTNISIPYECSFIIDFYPKYGACKNWNKKKKDSFLEDLMNQPLFSFWNLDQNLLLEKFYALPESIDYNFICKFICLQFNSLMPKQNILYIGDKNPIYTIHIKRLSKIFPEAKFIHITRDYKDQISSMLNVNFEKPLLSSLAYRWNYFNKIAREFSKKNHDKIFFVKYEELASDPEQMMLKIIQFLDITFERSIFEFYKSKDAFDKMYSKEKVELYHKELFRPINTSRIGIWVKNINENELEKIEAVIGQNAELNGYERKNANTNPFHFLTSILGIVYGRSYYFIYNIIYRLPLNLKRKIILSLDRSLKK
jgi:hypothetical protein